MRGAQLYDSIVVKSDKRDINKTEKKTGVGGKAVSVSVQMPGEMGGTMSKAMSYDVNPIYSL